MNTANVNQAISRQIFQILSKASLDTLSAGDIIKGRIQSLDNGLLLIKLLDGTAFTAKAPEGFTAEPGELIALVIGERQNDQVTARIISDSQSGNKPGDENMIAKNILDALDSLGVVNPERLASKVMDLLRTEPGMPLDKAAFLVVNNFSDFDFGKIIRKISEHEFNLHENLKSLENDLLNSFSSMDPREGASVLKPLLVRQAVEELAISLKDCFPEAPSRLLESISEKINEILIKTFMEEVAGQESASVANSITKEAFEAIIGKVNFMMTSGSSHDSRNGEGTDAYNAVNSLQTTSNHSSGLNSAETENLLKIINRVLENYHLKSARLLKGGETALKEIKEVIEKLFDKAYIKADNGETEDIDIKEKSQVLKSIMEFAQKAIKNMDSSDRQAIMPAFREIDNAFRFFSQVTTYDLILQLPIKVNREDTTGELYVMKRKKGRKRIDAENFTLFLSLKTDSLGLVESYLNAVKKRITISFKVENENLVKLVKDNYKTLYDGLFEKGFILVEMKCKVLDSERINPFNAGAKAKELFGAEARVDIRI